MPKDSKLYEVWRSMKKRCYSKTCKSYKYYGARNISICDEWKSNYTAFEEWAMKNGYAKGLSIDRIDVDGNYCPENCRWATAKQQANNQRKTLMITYCGITKSLHEWADEISISPKTLYHRLYHSCWETDRAFTEAVSRDKYHRTIRTELKGA